MMSLSIRAASIADIDAIVMLNREVQQLHAALEPRLFRAQTSDGEISAFFAAKLAAVAHHIRLAENGCAPVGYVWFEVQDRPETPFQLPNKRIYVHNLSVQSAARRSGVGAALMSAVKAEALLQGIKSIALDTWAANQAARDFFAAEGFSPFNLVLGLRLP